MSILSKANLAANRANAKKSTGPRTTAGKQRASLNALKHGLTAQTLILPGEDLQTFTEFHARLRASLSPANAHEESLVSTLAQTQWHMDRMRAHETNLFALGHERFAGTINSHGDDAIQIALAAAQTMKSEADALKSTSLYLQRNARMYEMTLRQLLAIQATRKAEQKSDLQEAVRISRVHRKLNIPFASNDYGLDCIPEEIEYLYRRKTADTAPYTPPAPRTNAA